MRNSTPIRNEEWTLELSIPAVVLFGDRRAVIIRMEMEREDQVTMRQSVFWLKLKRPAKCANGFVQLPLVLECVAQIVVSVRVVRIEFERMS